MSNIRRVAIGAGASPGICAGVAAAYCKVSPRIECSLIPARMDRLSSGRFRTRPTSIPVPPALTPRAQYCPSS